MIRVVVCTCAALVLSQATADPQGCYADETNPYVEFGTKTAYEHVRAQGSVPAVEGCRAVRLWLLSRHGTRYPRQNTVQAMGGLAQTRDWVLAQYKAGATTLCARDADNLRDWTLKVTPQQTLTLSTQGKYDMYNMARRLATRFPDLLTGLYTSQRFVFHHTSAVRTKESAEYFAKGLFGLNFTQPLPYSASDNSLLYGYKECPAWQAAGWADASNTWLRGPEVGAVVTNVRVRLGLANLTLTNVTLLYDMCRFQRAWRVDLVSPWCAAFTEADLKVLEYWDDLENYYGSGPGNTYSRRLACPVLRDLVTALSGDGPPVRLSFAHDALLTMVLTALGLAPPGLPPAPSNYPQQQHRQYRTSRALPFAANVLVALYNCSGTLKAVLSVSERPVALPGCDNTLCDWDYLRLWLAQYTDNSSCLDNSFCFTKSISCVSTLPYLTLVLILVCGTLIY